MAKERDTSKFSSPFQETRDVLGVELLGVGKWPASPAPITLSATDLFTLVRNANEGAASPIPLSFGHSTDRKFMQGIAEWLGIAKELVFGDQKREGHAAFGQVSNLRAVGDKVFADFKSVPKKLAELIQSNGNGFLTVSPTISMSGWFGERGSKIDGPVLLAVSLLGASPPAYTAQRGLAEAFVLSYYGGLPEDSEVFTLEGKDISGVAKMEGDYHGDCIQKMCADCQQKMSSTYRDAFMHGTLESPVNQNPGTWPGQGEDFDKPLGGDTVPITGTESEATTQMNGKLDQIIESIAKLNNRIEAVELNNAKVSVTAMSSSWTHLNDEEKVVAVDTISKLRAIQPEMADTLIEQHNLMASKVATPEPPAPPSDPTVLSDFQSAIAKMAGATPDTTIVPEDGNNVNVSRLSNAQIKKYASDNNVSWLQAVTDLSQDSEIADVFSTGVEQSLMMNAQRMHGIGANIIG